jgi:hypothetical protein
MSLISEKINSYAAKYDGELDDKYLLLRKVYPTIQHGRDLDLERYLHHRQNPGSSDWKNYYNNLSKKYTEDERTLLIHILRRYEADFERIFTRIIERLFERVSRLIRAKIDYILSVLKDHVHSTAAGELDDRNILKKLEESLKVCSSNRDQAMEDLSLLKFFSGKFGYVSDKFENAATLLEGYLDGSLFVEEKAYEFNIREEERKYRGEEAKPKPVYPRIRLSLTEQDIERFLISPEITSEYEATFAYFQKYLNYSFDREFATKLFYYSKTYDTNHFRIYESIRRGLDNKLKNERIFDDIFKVICDGRYVYDVNREKTMIGRILFLENAFQRPSAKKSQPGIQARKALPPPETKPEPLKIQAPEIEKTIVEEPEPAPETQEPIRKEPVKKEPAKKTSFKREPIKKERNTVPVMKKKAPAPQVRTVQPATAGKSFAEMLKNITTDPGEQRMVRDEFKNRLPKYILNFYNAKDSKSIENEAQFRQVRDAIKYMMSHFEGLLSDLDGAALHKAELERLNMSLSNAYTIIMECFNDVKSAFLTHNLENRPFSWFFNLFPRNAKKPPK